MSFAAVTMDRTGHLFSGITDTLSIVTLTIVLGALLAWASLVLYRSIEAWMASTAVHDAPHPARVPHSARGSR
jgi:ABC-type arginine/histidine transport system permease subunit